MYFPVSGGKREEEILPPPKKFIRLSGRSVNNLIRLFCLSHKPSYFWTANKTRSK